MRPGDTARLDVWRNRQVIQKDIVLGRLSTPDPSFTARENETESERNGRGVQRGSFSLGFDVIALATPENPEVYDLIVSDIISSTEAAQQGLKEGYIIRKVNGINVQTLEELSKQLRSSSTNDGAILIQIETPEGVTGHYQLKN